MRALHHYAIRPGGKGLKLLQFPLVKLVLAISLLMVFVSLAVIISDQLVRFLPDDWDRRQVRDVMQTLLVCAFSLLAYWLFRALIEGESLTDLSLRHLLPQTLAGVLLGSGFITLIMVIMALSGAYTVTGWNGMAVSLPIFLMALQAGVMEEILSRGILFRIIEEGVGTWVSVILSALIFGFLHGWNDNASLFSSLSIALTAGIILALLYVVTRQLWIPIGMHFAWNFTLGGVYGAPVSGMKSKGMLTSTLEGSEWLTGGAFGPEASLITIGVFMVFGILLTIWIVKKHLYYVPGWMKKLDKSKQAYGGKD